MINKGDEVLFKSRLYKVTDFVKNHEGNYNLKLQSIGHKYDISMPVPPEMVDEIDNDITDITPQDLKEYMSN